ncbi:membrane lipoprotein lipid attachment site-containing protein [Fibrella forsythiae]|uniref:Membrane lipoprotein lipid attachment site-containing protein n=1 Tax=Fibrella forsythiae TaxID=2817061 RepID=A0ABS3JSR8_9BACT|nr:membrane lipoprotein lipid attachment site-containing protein [Fibrella forsythiae]MBO0953059.1 membrane lipoprotein lipid attachment site-containing protein [Fibrella forsythiae]
MKKMVLFLVFVLTLTACKKETDIKPTPALADKFAGSYQLNSFRFTGGGTELDLPTLPVSGNGQSVSGAVTLVKVAGAKLALELVIKATGANDYKLQLENLEVKQIGAEYGLFSNNQRIADVDGTALIFNVSETDPTTKETIAVAFVARR